MKVKECEQCKHYQRRKYSTYHEPKNYHPIGFSHVYAYCVKHKKRCRSVNKCQKEVEE